MILNQQIPPFQEVLSIINRDVTIPNGGSISEVIPVVGYVVIYGMVYSDQAVTVTIRQGVSDRTGALVYRKTDSTAVGALSSSNIEQKVVGKFAEISIANSSGAPANVEAFIGARAYSFVSESSVSKVVRFPVTTGATQSSTTSIPANSIITEAWFDVTAAYTGGTTATIGNATNPALLQTIADNNPPVVGLYTKRQNTSWGGTTQPILLSIAGAPAVGSGFVLVRYVESPGV